MDDSKGATSLPVKEVQLNSGDPLRDPSRDLPRDLPRDHRARQRSPCVSPVQDQIDPLPPERRSTSRERLRIDRSPGELITLESKHSQRTLKKYDFSFYDLRILAMHEAKSVNIQSIKNPRRTFFLTMGHRMYK